MWVAVAYELFPWVSASMFKVSFLFSGLICPSPLSYRNTVHVVWLLRLQVSTACKVAIELYVTAHACPRFFAVPNFWASVFTGLCFFQKGLALCLRKDEMSDSFSISARASLFPPCVGLLWNGSWLYVFFVITSSPLRLGNF